MRLLIAAVIGILSFAALGVAAHATPYFPFDPPITEALQAQGWIGPVAVAGNSFLPTILLVMTLPLLWLRRSRAVAVIVGVGVLLAGVIGEAV